MLMQPLRNNQARRQTSTVRSVSPPIKGWNARDDITNMKPGDAVTMVNFIPGDGRVEVRLGKTEHVTGLGSPIQTLMEYRSPDAAPELFGATTDSIYDVTAAGAVGAAAISSLNSGFWSHTMFATAGGTFLVCANGSDSVRNYDGSAWSTPSITGVTSSTLITVTAHQSRLWFVETDSAKVWYLGTLAISGAATSIDFGGLSRYGGYLMAMASWTRDSGSGIEDLAVFMMSTGETHIYAGNDPSSTATWARVGTFKLPEPIGRNCFVKVGGDVGILTSQGLIPLAGVLSRAESAQGKVAITDKIRGAFSDAYEQVGTSEGWDVIEYPVGKLLIVSVPELGQFVMNTNSGGWCKFDGLGASCFEIKGTDLYMGGADGTVYKYAGRTDNGAAIDASVISAFEDFGTINTKCFRRIKPMFSGPSNYRPSVGIRLDYDDSGPMSSASLGDSPGTSWDEGAWDDFAWAPGNTINRKWQSLSGEGTHGAVALAISTVDEFIYTGAKVEFEMGDHL